MIHHHLAKRFSSLNLTKDVIAVSALDHMWNVLEGNDKSHFDVYLGEFSQAFSPNVLKYRIEVRDLRSLV